MPCNTYAWNECVNTNYWQISYTFEEQSLQSLTTVVTGIWNLNIRGWQVGNLLTQTLDDTVRSRCDDPKNFSVSIFIDTLLGLRDKVYPGMDTVKLRGPDWKSPQTQWSVLNANTITPSTRLSISEHLLYIGFGFPARRRAWTPHVKPRMSWVSPTAAICAAGQWPSYCLS